MKIEIDIRYAHEFIEFDKRELIVAATSYAVRAKKPQSENWANGREAFIQQENNKKTKRNANEKENRDWQRRVQTINCIPYFGSI